MKKDFLREFLRSGAIVGTPGKKVLVGWGDREWCESPKDPKQPAFYFPDFFLEDPKPWFQHKNHLVMSIESLLEELHAAETPPSKEMIWKTTDFAQFHRAFSDLQQRFTCKELEKAVPFIFDMTSESVSQEMLVKSLTHTLKYTTESPAYIYGYWGGKEGVLGATPEMLFQQQRKQLDDKENENIIHTVACAGTCPKGKNPNEFLNSNKDIHEHEVVVKGIKRSLKPYGTVIVGERRLLNLCSLSHLYTDIRFIPLKNMSFEKLVSILHPTPALGAYPPEEGMMWLKRFYQNTDRKHYGAPVGYILSKGREAFCLVGIRNAQWSEEGIRIGAGCGIVQESNEMQEWEELLLKIRATKDLLSL